MSRSPTIHVLTALTLLLSIPALCRSFTFSAPQSSGKKLSREAVQGPLSSIFSICSTSQCEIIDHKDSNKVLFSQTSSAPFIYSSQLHKKSLVTGAPTALLDFASSKTPQSRTTTPTIVVSCKYDLGENWICISGSDGKYFLYSIKDERVIVSYDS